MEKIITIEMLTDKTVSIKTERFIIENGEKLPVGNPHRKLYENNEVGRREVIEELPEQYQNAIFAIWDEVNAE